MPTHLGNAATRASQRTGTRFTRWQACLAAIAMAIVTLFGGMAVTPAPSAQAADATFRDVHWNTPHIQDQDEEA